MIKAGDYVLVSGEANEVYIVDRVQDKSVILNTGWAEPIDKCTLIPKEFHDKVSTMTSRHLDFEIVDYLYRKEKR